MYVSRRRRIGVTPVGFLAAFLAAWPAGAQTKLHLPSQSSQADFSQFSLTRPVKMSTVLPGSCQTGELLFKTDNPAGTNLHLCSNSAWYAVSAEAGGTSVSELSDLKVTSTTTVVSVGSGRFRYLDSAGRNVVAEIGAATLTRVSGSESGMVRLEVDDAGGTPVLRCLMGTGLTGTNYAAAGCTKVSQDNFSVGAQALATVMLSGGVWGSPVDLRVMGGTANYAAGTGLIKTGNIFSMNPAIVPFLATANTWIAKQTMAPGVSEAGLNVGVGAGDPTSPVNGDVWYNSVSGRFRCREDGVSVDCIPAGARIVGGWSASGASGDVATQELVAAAHSAGVYRVCGAVSVTTGDAANFTEWTVNWRDVASGSDLSRKLAFDEDGAITTTPSKAAAGAVSAVCKVVRSTGVSAIVIDPGDAGGAVYSAHFSVERLQ